MMLLDVPQTLSTPHSDRLDIFFMHNDYAVQNDYREVLNHMRAVIIDETLYKMALYAAHCHYMGDATDWEIDRGLEYTALTIEEAADLLEEMSRIYLAELR